MADQLKQLAEEIKAEAKERGLVVYPALTSDERYLFWDGDWKVFLDLAAQVNTRIVYFMIGEYDLEYEVEEILRKLYPRVLSEEWSRRQSIPSIEEKEWVRERIVERLAKWQEYNGQAQSIHAIWYHEGRGHGITIMADWHEERQLALSQVAEEVSEVERANRILPSEEDAKRLHELAKQMAHHKRYADATNEAKRIYMAEQLFPDEERYTAKQIAERAALYYWWYVEPEEKVSKADQANELYKEGETIKNIAVILKMTEAAVRRAIES